MDTQVSEAQETSFSAPMGIWGHVTGQQRLGDCYVIKKKEGAPEMGAACLPAAAQVPCSCPGGQGDDIKVPGEFSTLKGVLGLRRRRDRCLSPSLGALGSRGCPPVTFSGSLVSLVSSLVGC